MSLFVDEYWYATAANAYKCHSLLMNIGMLQQQMHINVTLC